VKNVKSAIVYASTKTLALTWTTTFVEKVKHHSNFPFVIIANVLD
jgi:hypothetical protein